MLQPPQLVTLVMVSAQTPLQVIWPAVQPHEPFAQAWPPWHLLPQEPQFVGSLVMLAQLLPLQTISPAAHELLQTPLEHTRPPVQALPQVPQFAPSALGFTQLPLQFVSIPEHTHAPPEQLWPWPHVLLQPPQLELSVRMSTHMALQMP